MPEDSDPRTGKWEKWLFWIFFLYFGFKLLCLAAMIGPNIPPDEVTHVGIAQLYAKTLLFIEDSPESHPYGLVSNVPYLYHFLLGHFLKLNVFNFDNILFLRILNIIISILTVFFSYRLVSFLTDGLLVRILFLIMLTNTLMFTFISFAVNYDNLVNLFSVLSILFLVKYFKRNDANSLLYLIIFLSAGSLTKRAFLPLALILFLILIFHKRSDLLEGIGAIFHDLKSRNLGAVICVPLCCLLILGTFWLYGKNLVVYGNVIPNCGQVLAVEACMQNRIYARGKIVSEYRSDLITFQEAVIKAASIPMASDKMHTIRLLENERNYKSLKPEPLNRFDYFQMVFKDAIMPTVFGIQAHLSLLKSDVELIPYKLILGGAFIFFIRYISVSGSDRLWVYLSLIFGAYVVFLIGFFNYNGYLATHAAYLGVQGRYIFPVIVPFYLVVARYLLIPFRKHLATIVFLLVAGFFIWGDFFYFSKRVTDDWRRGITVQSSSLNTNCKQLDRSVKLNFNPEGEEINSVYIASFENRIPLSSSDTTTPPGSS